jgi:O-antigen/teichoic acid export membrane protein
VAKTLISLVWIYGGRGVGLLWTLILVQRLGVSEYGLYAMATVLNGIVGNTVDNAFAVRAIRESEEHFLRERTMRYLVAVGLVTAGAVTFDINYVIGFGLMVAGGEIALNVVKSQSARDGHPDKVYRLDTARQFSSAGIGAVYLYTSAHPTLTHASLLYCTPYVLILLVGARLAVGHRPAPPGPPRLIAALTGEMLGTTLYLGGDVLLLGTLVDTTAAGYYQLAWVVAAAVAAAGQSFGMTYHEPLRESGGDLSAAPPLRNILRMAALGGSLLLIIGICLFAFGAPTPLATTMMIMGGFAALRICIFVLQVILYTQRRDVFRLTIAVGLVPVKLGMVAALATLTPLGAVGAAIAATVADAIMLAGFTWAVYRPREVAES